MLLTLSTFWVYHTQYKIEYVTSHTLNIDSVHWVLYVYNVVGACDVMDSAAAVKQAADAVVIRCKCNLLITPRASRLSDSDRRPPPEVRQTDHVTLARLQRLPHGLRRGKVEFCEWKTHFADRVVTAEPVVVEHL